jgi:hypothetical protein
MLKEPATCTSSAVYYYGACKLCGLYGDDTLEFGEPLGHTEVILASVDPTFLDDGLTEGSFCSVCDEILVEQIVVESYFSQYDDVIFASAAALLVLIVITVTVLLIKKKKAR